MNFFVLAGLIFSTLMAVVSVSRLALVLTGRRGFHSDWGFQINVAYVVVFGTLAFWLSTIL